MTRKAALYARLSSDRDLEAVSIQDQLEACRERAEARGWRVVTEFTDRNISASVKKPRPGFDALVEAIRRREVDAIVVRETARLYRRPAQLEELIELLEEHHVAFESLFEGEMDLSTSNGRLMARIRASVDKAESERIGERVRLSKVARRAEGRHNGGGRRAYGYSRQDGRVTKDRAEAKIIRDVARRVLAGESLNRIAADLNSRGVPTSGGGRWRPQHVQRMLTGGSRRERPFAAGGNGWPAILTEDEVELLRARLAVASKFRPKEPARGRKYSLTGLVECSECGTRMVGSGGYYRCSPRDGGCGRVGIKARSLEEHMAEELEARRAEGWTVVSDVAPAAEVSEELLAELREVTARLLEVGEAIGDGTLSVTAGGRAEQRLEERRKALQEQIATAMPVQQVGRFRLLYDEGARREVEDWERRWEANELTEIELRDLRDEFGMLVERITVQPRPDRRKVFNPERVQVEWRV